MKRAIFLLVFMMTAMIPAQTFSQDKAGTGDAPQEKLYNFDDMLIDGAFRDPQGMFERARGETTFEGVLRLERSFLQKTEGNAQESSMQP